MFWANRWTSILRNTVQRLILIRRFFFFPASPPFTGSRRVTSPCRTTVAGRLTISSSTLPSTRRVSSKVSTGQGKPRRLSYNQDSIWIFPRKRNLLPVWCSNTTKGLIFKRDCRPYLVFWHRNNFFLKKKQCDPHSTLFFSSNTSSIIQLEISTIIAKYSPFTAFLNYSSWYKFNLPF